MNTVVLFFVLAMATRTLAEKAAVDQCRTIHHVDADATSSYSNSMCYLSCYIHGALQSHFMNEGLRCPGNPLSNYVCKSGSCVASTKQGHIDIEVSSASLSAAANAYASVCIQNSSVPMTLPISDRSKCTTCTTNMAPSGSMPQWNSVCAGSGKYIFNSDTRITIEVFDHRGTGNNLFLGGASLTVEQMLAHGDNHKQIHLAMTGGSIAGQVNTIITWTPLN